MDSNEIQVAQREGHGFIAMAANHIVQDQSSADQANDILMKMTAGLKEIEKKRKSFTAPINESLKEINSSF